MARIRDMTSGNPTKLLISFAVPMVLGNLFQQLYSLVDAMVVGRGVGVSALAAVGAAAWLDWLILGVVFGLTQGFSIMFSQRFGSEDQEGLRRAVAMSAYLSAALCVLMTVLSQVLLRPLLVLLNTPPETMEMTELYLRILFSGIAIITLYNLLSSILRALGDSKTPLVAMVIASLINIGLDFLFVMGFHWGVAGVSASTVIAQLCSALFCLYHVRKLSILTFVRDDWKPRVQLMKELMALGLPIAFQNAIIAVGGLMLQRIVNGFGLIFVAGYTAGNKLCGLMEMAGVSLGNAMGTFAAQNLGAGKHSRIREGLRKSIAISVSIAACIAVVMIAFGKNLARAFVTGAPDQVDAVLNVAYPYLTVMSSTLFVLYLLIAYRATLQGMGDTVLPMWSGIVELIMRIGAALILPALIGEYGVYIAEVSAWIGAAILLAIACYRRLNLIDPKPKKKPAAC